MSPSSDSLRRAAVVPLDEVRVTGARERGYATLRSTSATKTDTPLRDVPQSVSVVTHELIADQSMRGMADVVRYIPGVTMGQGEGHRDQPVIRGNSSTADFFVDGVRDDVQYLRDMYNVERVEALKGPNAMIFGRGGGGGVINRVTRDATRETRRAADLELGAFDHRRASLDLGDGVGGAGALRLNAMVEHSGSFRDGVELRRAGINPVAAYLGERTSVRVAYEHFEDRRIVDRGIPSWRGLPAPVALETFFGNTAVNRARARVDGARLVAERSLSPGVMLRSQTRFADYDKFYQNLVPGAVSSDAATVSISGYNNVTRRANLFNQTELVAGLGLGGTWHTLLVGLELGRQETTNRRHTGYFGGNATSVSVPLANPTVTAPVEFRRSATDADNDVTANVGSIYVQDQVTLSARWQGVLGARIERFALRLADHRDGARLHREDVMVSPRGGIVFKPVEPVSLYASAGYSALPSAGDQFASLNATTSALRPERFANHEVGAKWSPTPALAVTTALYRLDRSNSQARDANDPSRIVQTGAQRSTGLELEVAGSPLAWWQIAGGIAAQRARILSATTAAKSGATVPLVPARTLSLWNRVAVAGPVGVGVGLIHQGRSWAAIDNTVTLPAFTRLDGAIFLELPASLHLQLNVENIADARYYPTSQGNNNILPGSPRLWRLTVGR
ncbi:MAG TPA: TonB-dependent siderophore receptor [Gemmatimonadaceae bacterium]